MKLMYLLIGFLALALGCIGVVLPILPTTPFLLVSAFCFAKSSTKLNTWFKQTKLYQNNLEGLTQGRGMTVKSKCRILTTVTLLLAFAAYGMRHLSYGLALIGAVWLAHLIGFLFFVKTDKEQKPS